MLAAVPELAEKPDCAWTSETVAGSPAVLKAYDAPGPPNVAWVSALSVPSRLSSMTIFNGPLTDIPHLVSRCVVSDDSMEVLIDFRPRVNGAYDTVRPDGTYPGPDEIGRAYFALSGARKDMEKFYTPELEGFYCDFAAALEGVSPVLPTELDLLTRGPLAVSLKMPITDFNVQAVCAARSAAVDAWVRWVLEGDEHVHRPGAPVNTQYVYDTKFRQNCYGALAEAYGRAFGPEEGAKVAAADSGPLDEAYVGGGS